MKISNASIVISTAVAIVLTAGSAAFAQPAAPAAAPAVAAPAALPGVCGFSKSGALASSKLGKYIQQRMETIGKQTESEVQSTLTALQTEARAVESNRGTLTPEAYEQKQLEFRQRGEAFQRLDNQRGREIQLTTQKALQRFDTEANPVFETSVRERNCSIVLDSDSNFFISPTMDITPVVVSKLDAKITEFAFDRERLEQQLAQGQAPGGAAPAAAAPAAASRPVANPPAAPRPATTPARRPAGK